MLKFYPPSSTLFTPVDNRTKNVYNVRKQAGKTSDELHTPNLLTSQFTHLPVHNSPLTPLFVLAFAPQFYTPKITHFNLLINHLYPQSTAPINKKKKERLKRNT
jgi:hypothetical protein